MFRRESNKAQHFEDIDNSCPMVALQSDLARAGPRAKQAFENVFKAMVDVLERGSSNGSHPPKATAQAIAILCIRGNGRRPGAG